jgi:hypothetical protein
LVLAGGIYGRIGIVFRVTLDDETSAAIVRELVNGVIVFAAGLRPGLGRGLLDGSVVFVAGDCPVIGRTVGDPTCDEPLAFGVGTSIC